MKIRKNDDGTITVFVPKTDEVYDAEEGALFIPCVTTAKELREMIKDAPDAPATPEADPA